MRKCPEACEHSGLFQYADCIFHEDKLSYPRSVKAIKGIKEGPYWITTHQTGRNERERSRVQYLSWKMTAISRTLCCIACRWYDTLLKSWKCYLEVMIFFSLVCYISIKNSVTFKKNFASSSGRSNQICMIDKESVDVFPFWNGSDE